MLHNMKLNDEPFRLIESGRKTIELRLFDEKRRQVKIGDFIEFSHIEQPDRHITVRVTELYRSSSFGGLFSEIPAERLGFPEKAVIAPDLMDSFYPPEKQQKYGVLGIGFRKTELQRFIDAQENGYSFGETYATALAEIKRGYKASCWMWYVFPQIKGLGLSGTTAYFSINDLQEAADYLAHPILGARLIEISSELLRLEENDPVAVFGLPDAYKLRSCMTLFMHADPENEVFRKVLDKFCQGTEDDETLIRL